MGLRHGKGSLSREEQFVMTSDDDSEEEERRRISMEAATDALERMDVKATIKIEKESVYGYALVLPQVARSSGYDATFLVLAVRSLFFFVLNVCVQMWLLFLIAEASQVMGPLGGKMHLCDFGAHLDDCPDAGDSCVGPGGTRYTKTRLYSYMQWNIQMYVKNALLDIVPEKADEIEAKVDPGEYGMESPMCRHICCFIFVMGVVDEIIKCFNMCELLWLLPTKAGRWMYHYVPKDNENIEGEHLVKYKLAGMPLGWKAFNAIFVLLPKMGLCWFVLTEGFILLMDTGGIMDLVLGAMSLRFVLDLDEMICGVFTSPASRHIMETMEIPDGIPSEHSRRDTVYEGMQAADWPPPMTASSSEITLRVKNQTRKITTWRLCKLLFPQRLFLVILVIVFFTVKYYFNRCRRWHGVFVSQDMFLPQTSRYDILEFLKARVPVNSEPFWTMPDPPPDD